MIREKTFVTFIIIIITIDHIPDIFCCVYNLSCDPRGTILSVRVVRFLHSTYNRKSREKEREKGFNTKRVVVDKIDYDSYYSKIIISAIFLRGF